jgi:phosphoribosylformylglycinamidine synthase subunit PurS
MRRSWDDGETTDGGAAVMWQAQVYVTFKRGVLDPQGEAIRGALGALGFDSVADVRMGKYMQIRLDAADETEARQRVDEMCRRLLANPVIEVYRFDLARDGEAGK